DRRAGQLVEVVDLLHRHLRLLGDLSRGRVAAELEGEGALDPGDPVQLLNNVDRQPYRAASVGAAPFDSLTDPPRRVGGELEAPRVVELLHGTDQAEIAVLDDVEEVQAGVPVVAARHG